jgi:hypothetical protein
MLAIDPEIPLGTQPGNYFSSSTELTVSQESTLKSYCTNGISDHALASTSISKMLVLISMLFKGQKISAQEKSALKVLALKEDPLIISALQAYEVDNDLFELAETLHEIVKMTPG